MFVVVRCAIIIAAMLLPFSNALAESHIRSAGSIKTFRNFCTPSEVASETYDLCIVMNGAKSGKKTRVMNYELISTLVVPSKKHTMMSKFCASNNIDCEDMYLHLAQDAYISLSPHAASASYHEEKRLVPGWDARNDKNGDQVLDESEQIDLVNSKATARSRREARLPIYYWGPPQFDYVMNAGNPSYRRFSYEYLNSERGDSEAGIFFDTLERKIPGEGRRIPICEYPEMSRYEDDVVELLKTIMMNKKSTVSPVIGNGWQNKSLVIDGTEWETALNIFKNEEDLLALIRDIYARDHEDKLQLVQHNPFESVLRYQPQYEDLRDDVTSERDRLFGLAFYYAVQGRNTYFGVGMHPYQQNHGKWLETLSIDLGQQLGSVEIIKEGDNTIAREVISTNEAKCGFFKTIKSKASTCSQIQGKALFRIRSNDEGCNIINARHIALESDHYYTIIYSVKVNDISGSMGAEIYLTGFSDAKYLTKQSEYIKDTKGEFREYRTVLKTGKDTRGEIKFRLRNAKGEAILKDLRIVEGRRFNWDLAKRKYTKGDVYIKLGPLTMGMGHDSTSMVDIGNNMTIVRMNGVMEKVNGSIAIKNREGVIVFRSDKK